jgi:hypothetical protein
VPGDWFAVSMQPINPLPFGFDYRKLNLVTRLGSIKPWPTSATQNHRVREEKNPISVRKERAALGCERNCRRRRKRDRAADAGERQRKGPSPGRSRYKVLEYARGEIAASGRFI